MRAQDENENEDADGKDENAGPGTIQNFRGNEKERK